MSAFAVTRDEIDISNTPIKCCINGELRQSSITGLLVFDIPKIIETLSAGITPQPDDAITTRTPAGVGIGFDPPKYLKGGGIGILENEIVERTA
jgi:2-keto-4-pentenoate hydratase/2-oxohepta-3-ene-1,7-dioic acid hydratase in catechol pathway